MSKPKPKSRANDTDTGRRQAAIDELGVLQERLEPLKKREAELVKEIRGWAEDETKPHKAVVFEGRRYLAQVSEKPSKRTIPLSSRLKLLVKLGREEFCKWANFTVEKAEKLLSEAELAKYVEEEENTGTRTVKTVARISIAGKRAA